MNITLFTANVTGMMLLEDLKAEGLFPRVVTYARGFQRTGLACDFERFEKDFIVTYLSSNNFSECSDILGDIGLPVCIDFTKDFFEGAEFPVIYAHPSLLPLYRGYSAVTEQFERGVAVGGASFYLRSEKIDGGDIVFQTPLRIGFEDYPEDYLAKYAVTCAEFIKALNVKGIEGFIPVRQDDAYAVYLQRKRTRDALIDFNRDSFSLYNHIRAYSKPYFGSYFLSNGQKFVIWRAKPEKWQGDYGKAGCVLNISDDGIEIACGSGTILLTDVEGFKPEEFPFAIGDCIGRMFSI
ncbi:formyltransferase family protein [Seleniivibrio woodruffii]|uniref:formyltransferase family protein n=1 Tax=Seleniivibrio woodruffii TaxID=1078050 RepID=UPI0026EB2A89|nr:formyltransferase family protein [Seleniivibrio woodruffii]